MAADCKSAAPWSYGGSNPPLSTRILGMKLGLALGAYVILALAAWRTLGDARFRLGTLAVLAGIAVKTLLVWRRQRRQREDETREIEPM